MAERDHPAASPERPCLPERATTGGSFPLLQSVRTSAGRSSTVLGSPSARRLLGGLSSILSRTSPGTTGFDVVDSWGWLRVEVPGGLVKHPGNNKCESFRFTPLWPRCLTSS